MMFSKQGLFELEKVVDPGLVQPAHFTGGEMEAPSGCVWDRDKPGVLGGPLTPANMDPQGGSSRRNIMEPCGPWDLCHSPELASSDSLAVWIAPGDADCSHCVHVTHKQWDFFFLPGAAAQPRGDHQHQAAPWLWGTRAGGLLPGQTSLRGPRCIGSWFPAVATIATLKLALPASFLAEHTLHA